MKLTRREFMKTLSAMALAAAMPTMLPASPEAVAELNDELADRGLTLQNLLDAKRILDEQAATGDRLVVMSEDVLKELHQDLAVYGTGVVSVDTIFGMQIVTSKYLSENEFYITDNPSLTINPSL